ncbi:hypothetical protein Taro_009378 [Colocasia esculenta]|uniref:Uncharacterized protein n=1 Tax=Colocasia esculenta TaxID=4460 RepID=A0A843TW73_COLES|nr:hypothetical protein [Colocasia esculenta]
MTSTEHSSTSTPERLVHNVPRETDTHDGHTTTGQTTTKESHTQTTTSGKVRVGKEQRYHTGMDY